MMKELLHLRKLGTCPNHAKPQAGLDSDRGFTILELLIVLFLSSVFFATIGSSFLATMRQTADQEAVSRAEEHARTILDIIAYDLRMSGAGMPLGQSEFLPGAVGIGDDPLPILPSSDADNVDLRLSENGRNSYLINDYTPSSTDLTFSLFDASSFSDGDTIYLSDVGVGGDSGLRGTIRSISGNSITLESSYTATPGVSFASGSSAIVVKDIAYLSPGDRSGITRDDGDGPITLAERSTFQLEYLDSTATAMTLPLTTATIANNLSGIRLTISVQSQLPLESGAVYTATASQVISLRNLNLSR